MSTIMKQVESMSRNSNMRTLKLHYQGISRMGCVRTEDGTVLSLISFLRRNSHMAVISSSFGGEPLKDDALTKDILGKRGNAETFRS